MSVLKEFGPEKLKVKEVVAERSSLGEYGRSLGWEPDIFCLRIDADEYTPDSFAAYYPLFDKCPEAFTVFFNANSFRDAGTEILRCRDIGLDIQSHAFYHYTYNDYASNRANISRAKEFFRGLGIDTVGFVSPTGRWNASLSKALEDEGYKYSSEFAYDYMAFPSYPLLGRRRSAVLEIPVFPVAPELFFEKDPAMCDTEKILEYYRSVIDEMIRHKLPVMIYAHTHPAMPKIPHILGEVLEYALSRKGLKPISMTGFFERWTKEITTASIEGNMPDDTGMPPGEILGRPVSRHFLDQMKYAAKAVLDFERITPEKELKCGMIKKMLKLLARRIF